MLDNFIYRVPRLHSSNYKYTNVIRHKGTVIAFALNEQRRIVYTVLDLSAASNSVETSNVGATNGSVRLDVDCWTNPRELRFPNEIAEVGYGVADQTLLPVFKKGSTTPEKSGARVDDRDLDVFLSTTARLTADAPFQALSDERHVYVFRQAVAADHADMVFKQDRQGNEVKDATGGRVPVVDSSLLVDRFVLSGSELQTKMEVRFQRSRSKTRPASRKDSLGAKDLDGHAFFEPTQELSFIKNLRDGRFAVLLLPTQVAELWRWQVFAYNSKSGLIDSYNMECSTDGLFNTRGSQIYTCADHPEVFQLKAGTCVEPSLGEPSQSCGQELIPRISTEGYAESALSFEQPDARVELAQGVAVGAAFTQEAWIRPIRGGDAQPQALIGSKEGAGANGAPAIWIERQTRLRVGFGDGKGWHQITTKPILAPDSWNHVAVTFDGKAYRFYVDGRLREKVETPSGKRPRAAPVDLFGAPERAFNGTVDEIRLWNRVRSARDLSAGMNQRLTGLEPGLVGYWRFDEAQGATVYDQTGHGANGTIYGAKWVNSDAPLGENSGLSRSSFQISAGSSPEQLQARRVASGLTALLYHQQENAASGYAGEQKPLKRSARVMLAMATEGASAQGDDKPYIAVLDFGVSPAGRVAQVPDNIALRRIEDPIIAEITDLEDRVSRGERQYQEELRNKQLALPAVKLDMPLVHADPSGLTISGGLLTFAWTRETPLLFDSATGDLALYFRGVNDQFFVAYYKTLTERAKYPLNDKNQQPTLILLARATEDAMDEIAIEVGPGPNEDTCTVAIALNDIVETWEQVPREPRKFADVLNGMISEREYIGSGTFEMVYGQVKGLLVPQGIRRALHAGTVLMLGKTRATVQRLPLFSAAGGPSDLDAMVSELKAKRLPQKLWQMFTERGSPLAGPADRVSVSAKADDRWLITDGGTTFLITREPAQLSISQESFPSTTTSIPVECDSNDLPTESTSPVPIFFYEYDYGLHAQTTKVPGDLYNGSLLVAATVPQAGSQGNVADQQATGGDTLNSHWHAAAPGRTLRFDPEGKAASGSLHQFDTADLTMEAWIRPTEWPTDLAPVINHKSKACRYALGLLQRDSGGDKLGYSVIASVNDCCVESNEVVNPPHEGNRWTHIAAVFNQAWGLRFDGQGGYLDCGNDATLDITQDMTLEVFLKVPDNRDLAKRLALLTKGKMGQGAGPYALSLEITGDTTAEMLFEFDDEDGKLNFYRSKPIRRGEFQKVAVTRRFATEFIGIHDLAFKKSDGELNIDNEKSRAIHKYLKDNGYLRKRSLEPGRWEYNTEKSLEAGDIGGLAGEDAFQADQASGIGFDAEAYVSHIRNVLRMPPPESSARIFFYNAGSTVEQTDNYFKEGLRAAGGNKEPVRIGSGPGADFVGVISEVRLWNVARDGADIGRDVKSDEEGLVSWWRFEETAGSVAADSKSRNHAALKGNVEWAAESDDPQSRLTIYVNGVSVPAQRIEQSKLTPINEQFTLGASGRESKDSSFFVGEMEEVRIWKTARTLEQIQDNVFRRLLGEKEDLIAYYTFDPDPADTVFGPGGPATAVPAGLAEAPQAFVGKADDAPIRVRDHSIRGNDLAAVKATAVLSTAPIAEDTPQVRSALARVRTDFNDTIQSRPGVQEYADLQYDSDGNLIGVFKRCYSIIKNGQWQLITGFKVGDLATEWIGQVQFAPQLIGYIEGAPPVPSENLTATGYVLGEFADYTNASSVELTQADSVMYTYAASKDLGFDMAVDLKLGAAGEFDNKANLPFFSTNIVKLEYGVGVHSKFEHSASWLGEASTSVGRTTTTATKMELRGSVENEDAVAYPEVGRRFVPDNIGMALVRSETADVFAQRLKHNNALVSYQMRPNPDIPQDWNIITFPLNLRYVKQGTLDGQIGTDPDPNYPNALTYSPDRSYFKPIEAYALKNRIEREAKELETYYTQYRAADTGRAGPSSGENIAELKELQAYGLQKHNIANSYVWTADGGMFAESQETIDIAQEMIGGSYSFQWMVGAYFDIELNLAAGVPGPAANIDALFGGHLNRSVTKTKESQKAFGLNVDVGGVEGDVYLRDDDGNLVMDLTDPLDPKPKRRPGRVDAYRFMTFYLEPDSDHFDLFFNRVVDPIWLEQSDDPSAQALRDARQVRDPKQDGKRPACWRIMHRVTYVSRVLPTFSAAAPPSLEKTLQSLDIDSNYELIKQLEPFVRDRLTSFPEFREAVSETIDTYLPELKPHKEDVIQNMALYFGLSDGGASAEDGAGEMVHRTQALNQPPIVNAGEDQTVGLDGAEVKAALEGVVIDDRLQQAEAIFVTWEPVTAQAGVRIVDPHSHRTDAIFTRRGRYVLRLTADDGMLSASDDVVVVVDVPSQISAGESQAVGSLEAALEGQILDDGLGDPATGRLKATKWSAVRAGERVSFKDAQALRTTATFKTRGHYLLRLEVDNGSFTVNKEVKIAVAARVTDQLQVLYTFNRFEEDDQATVRDVSGVGTPLHLRIADPSATTWVAGGLAVTAPTILATNGPATRLTQAVKASGEITIETWVKPASAMHEGMARIVTLSSGPAARNFTLGQSKGNYRIGLRTTSTDDNASNKALGAGVVTTAGDRRSHLLCTRDRQGRVRLYLNGREVGGREIDGDLSGWNEGFGLALGNEFASAPASQEGHHRAWQGVFSLVAIYSRALTPAEVRQNFEFGADAHLPPVISTGGDRVINWSEPLPARVQLVASATHDRPSQSPNITWSQVGGPGGVDFGPEDALTTAASFPQKGRYVVRLAVDDGELMTSEEAVVVVNVKPKINIGTMPPVALIGGQASRSLTAEVIDTGLALEHEPSDAPTTMTHRWRQASGPRTMVLSNPDRPDAMARFTERGVYKLELTADNGHCATTVSLKIIVNEPPEVDAGAPQTVTLPAAGAATVRLQSRVTTGLGDPQDTLDIRWEAGTGSDAVTFNPLNQPITTATFAANGEYKLRLTATHRDTRTPEGDLLSSSAEVAIIVNQQPVVDAGPDLEITLPARAVLDGTVSDDGLPRAAVTMRWTQVSGPGQVTFADDKSEYTAASFSKPGLYVLKLTANDGAAEAGDEVTINVKPSPRVWEGLQVLYTFQEGQGSMMLKDLSGVGEAIDLIIEGKDKDKIAWSPGKPVLTIRGASAIASRGPATKLITAVKSTKATKGTNAITVEVWIKPAQAKYSPQTLPARIVTLSSDSEHRNFTLGQVDGAFKFRLRTSGNDDPNGEKNALQAGTVGLTKVCHLIYAWDAGSRTALLYQDGNKVDEKRVGGDLSNWSDDYRMALGNELTGERAWLGEYHLVAVYSRALSPDEVQQNFLAGPNP